MLSINYISFSVDFLLYYVELLKLEFKLELKLES